MYAAVVSYKQFREVFENIKTSNSYDARIQAATSFLSKHKNLTRPVDDRRRPYPVPIRPYWLVIHGYVHLTSNNDRRYNR